jgi:hypothetical protein
VTPPDDPRIPYQAQPRPSLFAKALTLLITTTLLVLGFMFSLLLVGFAVVLALVAWGYLWWKTRRLRRHLREQTASMDHAGTADGSVFEGEAVRVDGDDGREPPPPSGDSDSKH